MSPTKREVVRLVMDGKKPPYVPWQFGFTQEPEAILKKHFGTEDLDGALDNHMVLLGSRIGFFEDLGNNRFKDVFGVVWDRTVDKDIGIVETRPIQEPTLEGYVWPDPLDRRFFADIPDKIARYDDCFRVFCIGFSLFERAWTMRGMEDLLMDFMLNPDFVHEFLDKIADYNIAQVQEALKHDVDAVYFGDDWGQQQGLIMGYDCWKQFIHPRLERMYGAVRDAGKYVMIHSCGDVDELFDDLVDIGLNCFNPFQPEVMDIDALLKQYRGRLAFHGGISTQRTLPYGSVEDVRRETQHRIDLGAEGGYILAPAHDVEGDVSLENMLAFIEVGKDQPGAPR